MPLAQTHLLLAEHPNLEVPACGGGLIALNFTFPALKVVRKIRQGLEPAPAPLKRPAIPSPSHRRGPHDTTNQWCQAHGMLAQK